jgi:hypothetical protein
MNYSTKQDVFEQSNTWVLDLTRQVLTQIEGYTHPVKASIEAKIGPYNDSDAQLVEIAIGLEPEPFGLAHVYQCIPYANPDLFRKDFEGAVRRGWLIISPEGSYRATKKGKQYHACRHQEVTNIYKQLRTLPIMQLNRLDGLLREIIASISEKSSLSYKPAFEIDLRLANGEGNTLQRICCKLSHLLAFRDDAYLNAWMDQDVNSYVWEAFSMIYKGKAKSASGLAAELKYQRDYDEDVYKKALEELTARGWISKGAGKYEPTVEGLRILAEVARMMTLYFFEPWEDMEESKIDQLKVLLEALLRALKSPQTKHQNGSIGTMRNFGWRSAQWLHDKER